MFLSSCVNWLLVSVWKAAGSFKGKEDIRCIRVLATEMDSGSEIY